MEEMTKFLTAGWDYAPIPRVSHEGSNEGSDIPHLVGATKQHQKRGHFW